MDLTKIDKPFGDMDDATKGALMLAAHRGEMIEYYANGWWEISDPLWTGTTKYRVQPKPVIGEVVMWGVTSTGYEIETFRNKRRYENCKELLTFTFPTRDGQHVPGVYTSPDGLQIKIEVAE